MKLRMAVALLLLASLAAASGCAGVTRPADPTRGEYYTEKEFQKLSKAQRIAYCAALEEEAAKQRGCSDKARGDLEKEQAASRELNERLAQLRPEHERLAFETAALQSEVDYFEGLPRTYVVQRGDYLTKISALEEIYLDRLKWRRIYRANRGVIGGDPNLIRPGQELTIPRDWPTQVEVKPGESLWKIAGYWEVYGSGPQWTTLYEANRDRIRDPNVLKPGQVLVVPR